ncbi:MAG TPA: amidohydrolase family protein [Myxococcota bacterium]|jgi:predicted TIM-barrel fold metal-dependent hydrolase
MPQLPYEIFDGDNHYYEAEDAFTRHLDRKLRRRCMDWALVNGRKELLVAGAVNRFIPNPTFDPVARPGCLDDYYQGKNKAGLSIKDAFGALEPIHVEYRDRDARIQVMKRQRMEGALFFPTLGVGMEEALHADPPAVAAAFNAFNEWLHEDWGYAYKNMIFAAPYFSLMDLDNAVAQLELALSRDVRVIVMRPAPVRLPGVSRSLADPYYDRFWARVNEAGITVAMHGGDSGYGRYFADWGEGGDVESFKGSAWKGVVGGSRAPFDAMAALVCHGLFQRFPRIRVCSIEMGANWVPWLIQSFKRAYGISPRDFHEDPVETFKRHVWISPFHEDDVAHLRDLIGADRLLMGSDWPHAEGLADPTDFIRELKAFTPAEQKLVMHDNTAGLVRRV